MNALMKVPALRAAIGSILIAASMCARAESAETQSLEELRNTVVNLLDALVQRGVVTREQAQKMVADAQSKAQQSAAQQAAQANAEKDAVHVTYVPEIVKEEIRHEVAADLRDQVTTAVVAQAKDQKWGVPGALPDWIKDVRLYGDVRSRVQSVLYASDNATGVYLDFNSINSKGGIGKAGATALLNTTQDRFALVGRFRFGATATLGNDFALDMALASGNAISPVSTNQVLGNYDSRWTVSVDRAAVIWNPVNAMRDREVDVRFGRFSNPFVTTSELIWDTDVNFEGVSAMYALDLFGVDTSKMERGLFLTVGAFPLQEVELSTKDKWLYAGQLGTEFHLGDATLMRLTGGYFDFENITGMRNTPDSTLLDFTAPRFVQKGNTMYDIRNDTDSTTNLFALAGRYKIANANLMVDFSLARDYHVWLSGEYAKNVGWDSKEVTALTGVAVPERTSAYDVSVGVGKPRLRQLWDWKASLSYRYVEQDAVLDAFNDSDFHLGGTDAQGYQLAFEMALARKAWLRLRYLSANEIDGPPLGIDVLQFDINGAF
jgi:polyhydroxyalkanoate synthesis regulator phasin